jgi:glycosyltransferase involved in cell wall biosynthesis
MAGGMEKHIYNLTSAQRLGGFDVSIAFSEGKRTHDDDIALPTRFKLRTLRPAALRSLIFYCYLVWYLLLNRPKFDAVHIHGDWSDALLCPLIKWLVGANVTVFSFHGFIGKRFTQKKLLPKLIKYFNATYCTGYESYKFLQKKDPAKVHFIHSGINHDFLNTFSLIPLDDRHYDVVSVANFVAVKNHQFMLQIAKKMPKFNFCFVGDGVLLDKGKEYVKLEGLSNVTFLGAVNVKEVVATLDDSKVFLLASLEEGTPTSVIEAMSRGLPVVATKVGGVEHIVKDSENGIVLDGYVINDFVKGLTMFLENKEFYAKVKRVNCSYAKAHSWHYVASNISKLFIFEDKGCK